LQEYHKLRFEFSNVLVAPYKCPVDIVLLHCSQKINVKIYFESFGQWF